MTHRKPIFYGWILVGFAFICYGFGISPATYGWTILLPDLIDEFGWSNAEVGAVRSLRVLLTSIVAPMVGWTLGRFGIRTMMTAGCLLSAVGFFYMSRIESLLGCFITYGVLGGLGVGFSLLLPTQTLVANWFTKYRARAFAIVLSAGGLVGAISTPVIGLYAARGDWRDGWVLIASITAVVAVIAALFIRTAPEQMGQHPDGAPGPETDAAPLQPDMIAAGVSRAVGSIISMFAMPFAAREVPGAASPESPAAPSAASTPTPPDSPAPTEPEWTASQVVRSPQFVLLTLTGIGYSVPWGIILTFGGVHLRNMGFESLGASAIIGTMAFMSIWGRFSGALSDFVSAQRMLAIGLAFEALGCGALIYAATPAVAYAAVTLLGLGFGCAYISTPVVFSNFFGRKAFATATGTRFLIGGVVNALAPIIAGFVYDIRGSYSPTFLALLIYGLFAVVVALNLRHPGAPPETRRAARA